MSAKTPIYDWHAAHGGKLVEFAGWQLPVSYADGVIAEHLATRKHGGLFDISHMGRFAVSGPGALPFLEELLTNRAGKLTPGRAQYTLISDPDGRPIDDAYLYCQGPERYLLVVNAANREAAWAWLSEHNQHRAELEDISLRVAMLAVQGPDSEALLGGLLDDPLPPAGRNHGGFNRLGGVELYVSRTGYTGEPVSFELFPPWEQAAEVWQALAQAGAARGVVPVGLGARDTLRLEAALPLYGHEYGRERPIMEMPTARLGVDLGPEREDFMGKQALAAQAEGLPQRVYLVAALSKGMMREGSPVLKDGEEIGALTSATTVPAWRFADDAPGEDSYVRPLGLARLPSGLEPGDQVEIVYRKRVLPGRVVKAFARPSGRYLQPIEFEGGEM